MENDIVNDADAQDSSSAESNPSSADEDIDGLIDDISKLLQRTELKKKERSTFEIYCMSFAVETILGSELESIFEIDEEVQLLLKDMCGWVTTLKKSSQLKGTVQETIELIREGTRICRAQVVSSNFEKFLTVLLNSKKVRDTRKELKDTRERLREKMVSMTWELTRQIQLKIQSSLSNDDPYDPSRHFPSHAVGLEKSIEEVRDLLEFESQKTSLAVVLHGVRGMGKTTLADAVFSFVRPKEYKSSRIRLFGNTESTPDIIDLQKMIIKDLNGSEKIPEIRRHEEGQRELANILKKMPAYIYIDNVLREDELRQLLPEDMNNAKKVRLLITARNSFVGRACPMKARPKMYPMKCMSVKWASVLFKQKLFDDMERKLNDVQVDYIIKICDGNPLMLIKVAKALCFEEDKQVAKGLCCEEDKQVAKAPCFEKVYVMKSINKGFVVEERKNKEKIEGSNVSA